MYLMNKSNLSNSLPLTIVIKTNVKRIVKRGNYMAHTKRGLHPLKRSNEAEKNVLLILMKLGRWVLLKPQMYMIRLNPIPLSQLLETLARVQNFKFNF